MLQRVKCGCWCGWKSAFYPRAYLSNHKFVLDSALKLPVLVWLSNELHQSIFALNIMYECHVFKLHLIWFSHTQKSIRRRPKTRNIPIPPSLSLLPSPFYLLSARRPPSPPSPSFIIVSSLPFLPSPFHPLPLPPSSPSPSFIPVPSPPSLFHSLVTKLPPCPLLPLLESLPSLPFPSFNSAKFSFSQSLLSNLEVAIM